MKLEEDIERIILAYKEEIGRIQDGDLNSLTNVEKGLSVSRNYTKKLRLLLRSENFENTATEIRFFKHQKPHLHSKIKFYSKLYQFLLKRPQGSIQKQREFIDAQIEKLQEHYKENLDFVKYFREGSTYLDKYYFLREADEVKLVTDTAYYLLDDEFSTSYDNLVAKIMAYDLLINPKKPLHKNYTRVKEYVR